MDEQAEIKRQVELELSRESAGLPRDAQLIISLLHQMGIQDWEPRVINQLLEYTFRERPCPCALAMALLLRPGQL